MNPLADEWSIQHRAEACAVTGRPFAPGENFYTLLFREGAGFRRQDLSEEAWRQRNENLQPFSFWRARFEPPPAAPPEPLPKENAEELFRRLVAAADRANANACYVLAAMLERKRILKQIRTENGDRGRILIYEHGKTGDVFVVPDPQLRLDELEEVQMEVMGLMTNAECRMTKE
ncbi:MAG TPA: hypothetical protein VNW28_09455 [Chthoniobacterales bacterium]|jgi:hypothetical protein|nr:hypothetical protein [Chthoniobacterales bacterium]